MWVSNPPSVPVCVRLCLSSWLRLAKAFTQEEQLKTRGFWELGDGPGWCSFSCSCEQSQKVLKFWGHRIYPYPWWGQTQTICWWGVCICVPSSNLVCRFNVVALGYLILYSCSLFQVAKEGNKILVFVMFLTENVYFFPPLTQHFSFFITFFFIYNQEHTPFSVTE